MGDITIKLKEDSASCTIEYEKQLKNRSIKTSKNVSVEDFLSIFQKIESSAQMLLPRSCVGWKTIGSKIYYYLDFPAQTKMVVVKNKSSKVCFYDTIPVPRTLFVIGLNKNSPSLSAMSTQIYALKGTAPFSFTDFLYHMPMLNVFSDHRVCWGSNSLNFGNDVLNLSKLDNIYNLFWESNFNFDLTPQYNYDAADKMIREAKISQTARFEDLLRLLHTKESFPEELLVG